MMIRDAAFRLKTPDPIREPDGRTGVCRDCINRRRRAAYKARTKA